MNHVCRSVSVIPHGSCPEDRATAHRTEPLRRNRDVGLRTARRLRKRPDPEVRYRNHDEAENEADPGRAMVEHGWMFGGWRFIPSVSDPVLRVPVEQMHPSGRLVGESSVGKRSPLDARRNCREGCA